MSELPNKPNLLPREIQTFLDISRATLYRWLKDGKIPAKQIGDSYRIPRQEFLNWYQNRTVKPC